jgi:hypothetical protein
MKSPFTIKTQFEIRFTPILNFDNVVPEIVSPYQRLATLQTHEYGFKLSFEEGYYLEIRNNNLIFYCKGDVEKPETTLKYFFELYEKITKLKSYGKTDNVLLAKYALLESDENEETIVKKFRKDYFSEKIPTKGTLDDIGIVLESTYESKLLKTDFGIFKALKDMQRFVLDMGNLEYHLELKTKKGYLIIPTIFEKLSKPTFETFREFNLLCKEIVNPFLK